MLAHFSAQSPYPFLHVPESWSLSFLLTALLLPSLSQLLFLSGCYFVYLLVVVFFFLATCTCTGSHLTPQLVGVEFWFSVCRWVRIWPLCNMLGIETAFCLKPCSARELYSWLRTWLCFIEYKSTCVKQRMDEICCAMFWFMPHLDNVQTVWLLSGIFMLLLKFCLEIVGDGILPSSWEYT